MNLYKHPVWKPIDKDKWTDKKGMDIFSGSNSKHVAISHPGQGITESHMNSVSGRSTWMQLPNANEPGDDPYALSFPETARSQIERRREPEKEVASVQFNATCRRTLPFEDKVKVNSIHNMEGMDKAYLMTTNRSPQKILDH
jgi:hypothetical protein